MKTGILDFTAAVLLGVGLASVMTGCNRQSHAVVYEVGGTATEIGVAYRDETRSREETNVAPPWTLTAHVTTGYRAMVSARNLTSDGSVSCRITVDGVVLSEGESTGGYKLARCEVTVPRTIAGSETPVAITEASAESPADSPNNVTPSTAATSRLACTVTNDVVMATNAVGPSWIAWDSSCLANADVAYVDRSTWDIWVMDEQGGNRQCLTCYGNNILGVDFPLDEDGQPPAVHWKGDPEAHPTQPILFFKAENEHSAHQPLLNAPSIGWDNDIWALNVCSKTYTRLTQHAAGEGLQHSALSEDGEWYVYPLRYQYGEPPKHFGLARMVFGRLTANPQGDLTFGSQFAAEPNGPMYYEPIDIRPDGRGGHTLLYVAGSTYLLDPYRYDWRCAGESCASTNTQLQNTPLLHEEFTMFSPSGERIVWMRGPLAGLGYNADLYLSRPDFTDVQRLTWYNDCSVWPEKCKEQGAQLSRLEWNDDGSAVYYGMWIHEGPLRPFEQTELHRLDFAGACGAPSR